MKNSIKDHVISVFMAIYMICRYGLEGAEVEATKRLCKCKSKTFSVNIDEVTSEDKPWFCGNDSNAALIRNLKKQGMLFDDDGKPLGEVKTWEDAKNPHLRFYKQTIYKLHEACRK